MRRRMARTFTIFALLLALTLTAARSLAAEQTGTITGNGVNFRSGPGTWYQSLGKFYYGDRVTVTGDSNGFYAVSASGQSGYVSKTYVSTGTASTSSVLRRGSSGDKVRQLQGNLIYLGYLSGGADGLFGPGTETAVKLYQKRNGLTVDGAVGSGTRSKIQSEVLKVVNTVETAKKYLGTDYVYGGSTPDTGFDCSGLTKYAFSKAGISIPRNSAEQAKSGIAVPKSQLRAGDLVAFNSPVSHVGIYLGGGKFIHSPKTGDVVKITDLKYMNLTAARRLTGVLVNG